MSDPSLSSQPVFPAQSIAAQAKQAAQKTALQEEVATIICEDSLNSFIDEGAFSPARFNRNFESLEVKKKRASKEEEAEKTEKKEEHIVAIEKIEGAAEEFHQNNQELDQKALVLLRSRISPKDTREEILEKVRTLYPDPWLADAALDFLAQTTDGDLKEQVLLAKEQHAKDHDKDIRAGNNIKPHAQEFAKQGLSTPPQLRSLYRELTTNPKDANALFNDFSAHFDFEKMSKLIGFLLHSLGSDLKSKGPSIPRGELHILFSEARKLQAILGVFRFFQGRMGLIRNSFDANGIGRVMNFETLAKQFMRLIQEKYPSADRVLSLARELGLSEEVLAQVIVFTQMRDAMRQVAPRLFRSNQHRQDLLNAFLDALEELEEQMQEDEEEEEEEEEQPKTQKKKIQDRFI